MSKYDGNDNYGRPKSDYTKEHKEFFVMKYKLTHQLDKLTFGKHNGKTVRYIIEHDPQYILWLAKEKIVEFSQDILDNAEDRSWDGDGLGGSWGWDGDVAD